MHNFSKDILCISNLDWNAAWQRHHEFITAFSDFGFRIFFLQNSGFTFPELRAFPSLINKVKNIATDKITNPIPKNTIIINPKVIPPRGKFIGWINSNLFFPLLFNQIKNLGISKNPIIYTYLPSLLTLKAIDYFTPEITIYDYVTDFRSHPRLPKDFDDIQLNLLKKSNLVLTDSKNLSNTLPKWISAKIYHHGVSSHFFIPYRKLDPSNVEACYFGTIDKKILDFELLNDLAENGKKITLIGPIKGNLKGLNEKIKIKGQLSIESLAATLNFFDVILFPYKNSNFNYTVTPAKLYQSLATGRPIIAKGLPALKSLSAEGYLEYAENKNEFVSKLEQCLHQESLENFLHRQAHAQKFSSATCTQAVIKEITQLMK